MYSYTSVFEPYITGLVEQKRADGFSYRTEEYRLINFDKFCVSKFPNEAIITRELVDEWSVIKSSESKNSRNNRVKTLRQLCLYIHSLGLEAYVPRNIGSNDKPVQYIPSQEEMLCFFNELDSWEPHAGRKVCFISEYKVLFRLYYCCGLRLSEARLLKKENVDFDRGILTILHSKGHKDRLVYMPQDGIEMLVEYLSNIGKTAPNTPWLFPGKSTEKPISTQTVQRGFAKCWNRLSFAANADKGPTLHCLRHAFVVERINEWMKQDVNLRELLSHLSKYLGHASPSETFYYYHLVNKAFTVVKQKDKMSARVIPEVLPYE
jgi:integrase